jgi:ATP-binding cassette subfamily C protein
MLSLWGKGDVLQGPFAGTSALMTEFMQQQRIFSMLQGMRFLSADKRLSRRQKIIERQKKWLVDDAISMLLGEEEILYEESSMEQGGEAVDETGFILRQVMKALSMPEADLSLSTDIAKKLDSLSLLRRLAQKANIELRLVKLEGKKWYCRDRFTVKEIEYKDRSIVRVLIFDETSKEYITFGAPAEEVKKTEEVKAETIGETRAKVLEARCDREGVDYAKVCALLKVSRFEDITEYNHSILINEWDKWKERCKKDE